LKVPPTSIGSRSSPRRRLGVVRLGVLPFLVGLLFIAFGHTTPEGVLAPDEEAAGDRISTGPTPDSDAGLARAQNDLEAALAENEGNGGMALLDEQGNLALDVGGSKPFVLASVGKIYVLVAYLDTLTREGLGPAEADMELLQAMIRWSDNDSATSLWKRIGSDQGLADFLARKGLPSVRAREAGSWGTLNASAEQVAGLIWRLEEGRLLEPASTQMALSLLSDITDDQAWGISAGVQEPGSLAVLKNGWYPEDDGWRVNSAGAVHTAEHDYVLVILTDSQPSFEDGVDLVETMARRVNAVMAN
jgi:hypothetical protein